MEESSDALLDLNDNDDNSSTVVAGSQTANPNDQTHEVTDPQLGSAMTGPTSATWSDIDHQTVSTDNTSFTTSFSDDREAVIRQPVMIRYLEPADDSSELDADELTRHRQVEIFQGVDTVASDRPIVFREVLPDNDPRITSRRDRVKGRRMPVHLEKITNSDGRPSSTRPILIERWLPLEKSSEGEEGSQGQPRNMVLDAKEHRRKFKIVPEIHNLGTRRVNVKSYMKMLMTDCDNVTLQNGCIFTQSQMDIKEFRDEISKSQGRAGDLEGIDYDALEKVQI